MKITSLVLISSLFIAACFTSGCKKAGKCNTPTALSLNSVSADTAGLSWKGTGGAVYNIRYRIAGQTNWTVKKSLLDSIALTGLDYNKQYEWQVQADCATSPSDFTASSTFSTGCPTGLEGNNCDIYMNAKFAGTYTVNDTATLANTFTASTYSMTIKANNANGNSIAISNFADRNTATGFVNGNKFTVSDFTINNTSISHISGSINGSQISFDYLLTDISSGLSADCHAVGIK